MDGRPEGQLVAELAVAIDKASDGRSGAGGVVEEFLLAEITNEHAKVVGSMSVMCHLPVDDDEIVVGRALALGGRTLQKYTV